MRLGYTCQPQFRISQHERDLVLLQRILLALNCGNIVPPSPGRDRYGTSVANIKLLSSQIIPFFNKYPIYGAKLLDFQDFSQGVDIINKKGHLTSEGLTQLKQLAYR